MKYLVAICLLGLIACKTTRHTTRNENKIDSVVVKKIDTVSVKKSESTTTQAKKTSVSKVEKKDRVITTIVEDFKVPDTIKAPTLVRRTKVIDRDKGKITAQEVKTDTFHIKESKSDSTAKKGTDSIQVKGEDLKLDNSKKSTSGGWVINFGFIIIIIFGVFIILKKKGWLKPFFIIAGLSFNLSCIPLDHSQDDIGASLRKVTPIKDTICKEESWDWFTHHPAIHIHCSHDKR